MNAKDPDYPCFFTATILEGKYLLATLPFKEVVLSALDYLVANGRALVNGFVIMDNHIHLIWRAAGDSSLQRNQHSLLSYTGHCFSRMLGTEKLGRFQVRAADRNYQFWERNPLSVELYSERILLQKLNYIHLNPVKKGLCRCPEEYPYSSASFYHSGKSDWSFLSHYRD